MDSYVQRRVADTFLPGLTSCWRLVQTNLTVTYQILRADGISEVSISLYVSGYRDLCLEATNSV